MNMEDQYMTKIMQGPFLWEYLNETPYTIRHTMAEYFLANEPLVVDVGTYKIPLKVNGELISIDPLNTFPGGYNKDVKIFLEQVNPMNFSLSCLGLAIQGPKEQWDAFLELFKRSKMAVIEYSRDVHNHSDFDRIEELCKIKEVYFKAYMDMPDIKVEGIKPYPKRKFLVFK
jgi:hypothetical protein